MFCPISAVPNMAPRELSALEKFLGLKKPHKYSTQGVKKVPVLQINSGPPLVGLGTIACHLVKEAKRPDLLGDSAESRAVVQQWIEHRVTKLDRCRKDDVKTFLKDLDHYLQDMVYLAGNHFTLADILIYYGIHPFMVDMAIHEKEQFINVTRWFDHVQHYPGVQHHLPLITVLRNRIYTSRHH
eukprot:XP_003967956.2 PREDICTED: eukaryotic translation elongation factor 1 epsilon-1 [Takifugu rubripes]